MFCKQESVIQAAKFLSSVSELSLQVGSCSCCCTHLQCTPFKAHPAVLCDDNDKAAEAQPACMRYDVLGINDHHGQGVTEPEGICVPQERFWFCMAPANLRNPVASAALMRFAQKYAARKPVGADIHFSQKTPTTSEEMCEMEAVHQVQHLTSFFGGGSPGRVTCTGIASFLLVLLGVTALYPVQCSRSPCERTLLLRVACNRA